MEENKQPRRIGQSIGAAVAGILTGVILSLVTDMVMAAAGIYPPLGKPMADHLLVIATIYRSIYNVAGSYVTARLAPYRPMTHALTVGMLGVVLGTVGIIVTWNQPVAKGHEWYAIAVAVLAMPCAWAGGTLRLRQLRAKSDVAA